VQSLRFYLKAAEKSRGYKIYNFPDERINVPLFVTKTSELYRKYLQKTERNPKADVTKNQRNKARKFFAISKQKEFSRKNCIKLNINFKKSPGL